jgi:TrmH family RNA methyltransferase
VLEGFHPVKHALRFDADIEMVLTPDAAALEALALELAPDVLDRLRDLLTLVPPASWPRLGAGAVNPVMAVARKPAFDAAGFLAEPAGGPPLVLLEEPTHLGNVGAVIRTAAAAGAAAVLTLRGPDPWHPAALRGSAGLHFALPVARLSALEGSCRPLVAVHPEGEALGVRPLPPNAILTFGSERRGLSPDLLERADRRVAIPMRIGVSSLNLAAAAAIMLYTWRLGPESG